MFFLLGPHCTSFLHFFLFLLIWVLQKLAPPSPLWGGGPSLGLAHPHLQKEKALKGMFYLFLPEVVLVLALPRVVGASQPGRKAFTRLF